MDLMSSARTSTATLQRTAPAERRWLVLVVVAVAQLMLAELAEAIAAGDLVVPIQRTYPLDEVRAAFTELEAGHIAGKIVLIPLGCDARSHAGG
jgi:NADPH:quinone reductase-like Zn-dependent oxidoreductase